MHQSKPQLKILIIGDCGVGKSSLLNSHIYKCFDPGVASTIAYDFQKSSIEINGQIHDMAIWDTAGVEKHHALMPIFYRGCHGVILVYDATNPKSFDSIPDWSSNVDNYSRKNNVIKLLVGNKIDEPIKAVETEEARKFARRNGMLFLETSAKSRENVDEAFRELVCKIIENPDFNMNNINGINIDQPKDAVSEYRLSSYCGC